MLQRGEEAKIIRKSQALFFFVGKNSCVAGKAFPPRNKSINVELELGMRHHNRKRCLRRVRR